MPQTPVLPNPPAGSIEGRVLAYMQAGQLQYAADATIVRTMVDLSHSLGKQVCAEGVEDEETWRRLGEMGCDLAQGYWISKPKPAGEFLKWLHDTFWGLRQVKGALRSA